MRSAGAMSADAAEVPETIGGPDAAAGGKHEPVVHARSLHHVHPSGRTGLAGVDLTVRKGERIVILGPNGSGKSTLLRILATALRPGGGELRLLGRPVPPAPPSLRRRLGIAFDHAPHLEALTGRENAVLFGAAAGLKRSQALARLEPLLSRFALDEAADAPVSAWSFGMRRKLLLVQALLHDPALVLLDEPSVGLDPPAVDTLVELLEVRAADGAAVVAALNDPAAAARIARRVVMLDEGRIVAEGAPETLLAELAGGVRCTVEVDDLAPPLPHLPGIRVTTTRDGTLEAVLSASSHLPRLIQALVERDVRVRALRVREPDLSDVFRARTGRALESEDGP